MFALNKMGILRRIKPIHAREVAQAMILAAENKKHSILNLQQMFYLIHK